MIKISRLIVFMGRKMNHFTRVLAATLVLCMLVMLTACSDEWTTVGASSSDTQVSNSSSVSIASASLENNEDFVNKDLLALIGSTNIKLKQRYIGECFAYGTGVGAFRLVWFSPYILFDFYPLPGNIWNENVQPEQYAMDGGYYPENPYVDELEIYAIWLKAAYDASANIVTEQDSLRQLFITEDLITYELLAEKLNQNPDLTHIPNAYYAKAGEDLGSENHTLGEPIFGGIYEARYDFGGIPIFIRFVKISDEYVALNVGIGKIDESKLVSIFANDN